MKFFCVLLIVFLASPALAILDPDDNMMGLYFDLEADMPCLDGIGPYEIVEMHLMITHPTFDELSGFEAGFDYEGEVIQTSVELDGIIDIPEDSRNLIIGYGSPRPTSEAMVLASISFLYLDAGLGPVNIYLHATEPSSFEPPSPGVLLPDGVLLPMNLSAPVGPAAQLNGGCGVVETHRVDFDQIKSIYR